MRYRVAHHRAATQSGLTQVLGLMKDYRSYFENLISHLLSGELSRSDAAADVAGTIDIDEIVGERESLFTSCEWALRHSALPKFSTSDQELAYLLACLREEHSFTEAGRDAAIRMQKPANEA